MSESSESGKMPVKAMLLRFVILLAVAALVGWGGTVTNALTTHQATACAVFISIIFGSGQTSHQHLDNSYTCHRLCI